MSATGPGCAFESLDRDEPLLATASRVRRWLVVEQPGPWGVEALLESRLDLDAATKLAVEAQEHGVRVVLARRTERDGEAGRERRRVAFLVRSDRVHRWIERVEFDDPWYLTGLDLGSLDSDEPPGIGAPGPANLHLVCTNGKHDPCCADLGRPVVRALRDSDVDVWECSHIGGDRFAANIVCLPTGVYFGRVPPEEAERILRQHGEGILDLDCYRGRSCYPPLMQAAEIFARQHLDERRLDALHFVSATRTHGGAVVILEHEGERRVEVEVTRERGPLERLTCSDGPAARPWRYRLLAIR